MNFQRPVRLIVLGALMLLAMGWAFAEASQPPDYPNAHLLATVDWIKQHRNDKNVVIVDVRKDKYFDGKVIPGAIRMPWGQFRSSDPLRGVGGTFVGVNEAMKILGQHGISRSDTVVLYDSVERDGGATASYIFWVLELLGHEKVKVLNGGIDSWIRAGEPTEEKPAQREAVLYQAPPSEMKPTRHIDGAGIYPRLGDKYYQVLDVRSRAEYLGEAPNVGWEGKALKLGHVPGAYNVNYEMNWIDAKTKLLKPYAELQRLYPGLSPNKAVVTYCHSGRRSSHTYFVLRLMGFNDVRLYDGSWNEWGKKGLYFPVQTAENKLSGPLPGVSGAEGDQRQAMTRQSTQQTSPEPSGSQKRSGYISCGG